MIIDFTTCKNCKYPRRLQFDPNTTSTIHNGYCKNCEKWAEEYKNISFIQEDKSNVQ